MRGRIRLGSACAETVPAAPEGSLLACVLIVQRKDREEAWREQELVFRARPRPLSFSRPNPAADRGSDSMVAWESEKR